VKADLVISSEVNFRPSTWLSRISSSASRISEVICEVVEALSKALSEPPDALKLLPGLIENGSAGELSGFFNCEKTGAPVIKTTNSNCTKLRRPIKFKRPARLRISHAFRPKPCIERFCFRDQIGGLGGTQRPPIIGFVCI